MDVKFQKIWKFQLPIKASTQVCTTHGKEGNPFLIYYYQYSTWSEVWLELQVPVWMFMFPRVKDLVTSSIKALTWQCSHTLDLKMLLSRPSSTCDYHFSAVCSHTLFHCTHRFSSFAEGQLWYAAAVKPWIDLLWKQLNCEKDFCEMTHLWPSYLSSETEFKLRPLPSDLIWASTNAIAYHKAEACCNKPGTWLILILPCRLDILA